MTSPAAAPLAVAHRHRSTARRRHRTPQGHQRARLVLPAGDSGRELSLNLYYPADGGGYPLLLFSHGNWSGQGQLRRVIEHWVSHGYGNRCRSPGLLQCRKGIFNSLRYGQLGLSTRADR